jgi:hypothetical protein
LASIAAVDGPTSEAAFVTAAHFGTPAVDAVVLTHTRSDNKATIPAKIRCFRLVAESDDLVS